MEMQAAGIPVVATSHADIPYVVPFADHLVPEEDVGSLADALAHVATLSTDEWRGRAIQARRFVEEHHDARIIARQIEGLYAEAMEHDERG
jgi:glycosyltransferase involved in cell wall biosynthesis